MVSADEAPKSYEELLDPKWRGKIGMSNRSTQWYIGMMDLLGREKALAFMKRLADQDIQFNSGRTLTTQLLAAGEFQISNGVLHRVLQMRSKRAPVKWCEFSTPRLAELRSFVLHADAPHPNAGKLFIDYILSKEGQIFLNKINRHPIRKDVEVDPIVDKFRRNLFPIKVKPADQVNAYMKEFNKILLKR
jgi:iron(III) transport system substrate-binding protein